MGFCAADSVSLYETFKFLSRVQVWKSGIILTREGRPNLKQKKHVGFFSDNNDFSMGKR